MTSPSITLNEKYRSSFFKKIETQKCPAEHKSVGHKDCKVFQKCHSEFTQHQIIEILCKKETDSLFHVLFLKLAL